MRKATLAGVIIGGLLLAACGGGEPAPTPAPAPAPAAVDATKIFASNCASCHGQDRQGVTGLAPALTASSLSARSEAEIKEAIAKGRPGTAMPPWEASLNAAQIEALVKFLKTAAP
ncbi:MAG: cytochrome c [Chloroflexi bacterium]|nr:cytochrome c [Chloroflexota bacterium]